MVHIIYIEGNIGSGKSTLLNLIAASIKETSQNAIVLKEPVDKWATILQQYYKDKAKNAVKFQATIIISKLVQFVDALMKKDSDIILVERSPLSGQMFIHQLAEDGLISDEDVCMIEQWLQWADDMTKLFVQTTYTLYVRTDPNVCLDRVRGRDRNGECDIDVKLLNQLHTLHEKFIDTLRDSVSNRLRNVDDYLLCLDGNLGVEYSCTHVRDFTEFMSKLEITRTV